ncbi:MAG: bifunctional nuclease family protein [Prevotella sp.]|nr:bifunctional nuclease family protein [Prevotella sp.]
MERIKLKFKSITEIVGSDELGLLILTDEEEQRQLSIPCDKAMVREFSLRLNHAPITGRLLPEVLWDVLAMQTDLQFEILITGIIEGQYRALLVNLKTLDPVAIRISDAVLLSHIARLPIYIDKELMEKQSVEYSQDARGVAIPVNSISTDMLRDALDKAIDEEKYELASHLRDELRRRKLS